MKTIYTLIALLVLPMSTAIGQNWWPQNSSSSVKLQDVNFYSNNNGYLFGDTLSAFISTANAGAIWSDNTVAFTKANINSSSLPNANTIYAVGKYDVVGGKGIVLKSQNAGVSWEADSAFTNDLFDVQFTTVTKGFISGENGYIARTLDGGNNWLQLTSGTGEDLFSLKFVNDSMGWAVGTVDVNATILHTDDGGTTWSTQTSGIVEPLFAVDFVDNMNGWAVGELGNILATTDGGVTWSPQVSTTNVALFDVDFVDANNGWAVGEGGTVLKTSDGGVNWLAETSGTTTDILSVHMRDTTLGWFCGDGGEVRVYAENPPTVSLNPFNVENKIILYPNPASSEINISTNGLGQIEYQLISVDGRIVTNGINVSGESFAIDVSAIPSGSYIMIIKSQLTHQYEQIKFFIK